MSIEQIIDQKRMIFIFIISKINYNLTFHFLPKIDCTTNYYRLLNKNIRELSNNSCNILIDQ
jgi:hypothetical protein